MMLFDVESRSSRSELEVCYKCVLVSSNSVWVSSLSVDIVGT